MVDPSNQNSILDFLLLFPRTEVFSFYKVKIVLNHFDWLLHFEDLALVGPKHKLVSVVLELLDADVRCKIALLRRWFPLHIHLLLFLLVLLAQATSAESEDSRVYVDLLHKLFDLLLLGGGGQFLQPFFTFLYHLLIVRVFQDVLYVSEQSDGGLVDCN